MVRDFNTHGPFWEPNGVVVAPNGDLYGTLEGDYGYGDVYEFNAGSQTHGSGKPQGQCFD